MATVNPYLTFAGNCEEAFEYYKKIFGGEFKYLGRFSEMPPGEAEKMSEEDQDGIMHISLPLDEGTMLMGSDTGGEWASKQIQGNNISLSISANSKEKADHYYNMLSKGGEKTMPMNEAFWGDYFGMCTDKFGINWMISYSSESSNS